MKQRRGWVQAYLPAPLLALLAAGCLVQLPPATHETASSPGTQRRPPTISSFRFVGITADKVGRGFQATPNGDADGQFLVELHPQGLQRRVTGFVLYTSDARGNPVYSTQASQRWSTIGEGWILAVETGGRRLNPSSDPAVSHVIDGVTQFDLYADPGGPNAFARGEYITVVVRFSDGRRISAVTRME
jgi:hypothetical protein